MPLKTCNGICKRFLDQIKTRHSWVSHFDYRVYNMRVVRSIGIKTMEIRHNLYLRLNKSEEYLRCNKCECFMVPEMAFHNVLGNWRCPCCNTQLSYSKHGR